MIGYRGFRHMAHQTEQTTGRRHDNVRSRDTGHFLSTTHPSVLELDLKLAARLDTLDYHIYITSTIAAIYPSAITADPTSSPTKASHSRAPSATLTIIQTSHCV